MNLKSFIETAISKGEDGELKSLSPLERKVFLISEAEVSCDMGSGFEHIFRRHGKEGAKECSEAFELIGATRISKAIDRIEYDHDGTPSESEDEACRLISEREDYDYDSILTWVESESHKQNRPNQSQ